MLTIVLLAARPAIGTAQTTAIGIYSDAAHSSCSLSDTGAGIVRAYVVVSSPSGVTSVRFAAPKPDCFSGTWLAEEAQWPFVGIGNSQTGISIALGSCEAGSVHVLTMLFQTTGATGACCAFPITVDPAVNEVQYTDCAFAEHAATPLRAMINADLTCACSGTDFPPEAPHSPAPPDGTTGLTHSVALGWQSGDPEGEAVTFDLYLGLTPDPPLIVNDLPVPAYTHPSLQYGRVYYWKVIASDASGNSMAGPVWTFVTGPADEPPPAPFNPVPALGAVDQLRTLTLAWEGDAAWYTVFFGTNPEPPMFAQNVNEPFVTLYNLKLSTRYYWRAVAYNAQGLYTQGPLWTFVTTATNPPPLAPSDPVPPDHAVEQKFSPTLQWQSADPEGSPVVHDVYFGTELDPPLVASDHGAKSFQISATSALTDYYWKIAVRDPEGIVTTGPVWTFRTHENEAPSLPSTPSPASGAVHASSSVHLTWVAIDPQGGALAFDVYFGHASDPPYLKTTTEPDVLVDSLTGGSPYYWRIVAREPGGLETTGPVWNFSLSTPPLPPFNPTPPDGAVDVSRMPILRWEAIDPDGGGMVYDIYFGITPDPPAKHLRRPGTAWAPGQLARGGRYYWRIRANDTEGQRTLGPVWTFVTSASNLPPAVPTALFPPDEETDVGSQVTLAWTASDPEGLALKYDVYFGTTSPPPRIASNRAEASITVAASQPQTRHYWRIVARDVDGNSTDGPLWSFTTTAVFADPLSIGLYSDVEGTTCTLSDPGPAVRNVYVVLDGPATYTGLRFQARKPDCFGASWLSDASPYVTVGSSQSGVSIGFGSCVEGPVTVMTISYLTTAQTPGCCEYPVTQDEFVSTPLATACNFEELPASPRSLRISSDDSCPPCERSGYLQFANVADSCESGFAHPFIVDVVMSPGPGGATAGGVDIEFDPSSLTFVDCVRGSLTQPWQSFTHSQANGVITVAGVAGAGHDPAEEGTFARIVFNSQCCTWNAPLTLRLRRPTGDLAGVRLEDGHLLCNFGPDGDVNNDGGVSLADAQCTLEAYLSAPLAPADGCGGPSFAIRSDVDCTGGVTPADAQCIFLQWLDQSCVFCAPGGASSATARTPRTPPRVSLSAIDEGDEIVVALRAEGLGSVGAIGFDLNYPPGLSFVRVETGDNGMFAALQSRVVQPGRLRVGAYAGVAATPVAHGDLLAVRLRVVDSRSGVVTAHAFVDDLAGANDTRVNLSGGGAIDRVVLHQNSPNPFNPVTAIRFDLPRATTVRLSIYDVNGACVRTLIDGPKEAGTILTQWNGTDESGRTVATGIYFCVLDAGGRRYQTKMVLLK